MTRVLRRLAAAGAVAFVLAGITGVMHSFEPGCSDPSFRRAQLLEEAGSIEESGDACWWLSSGAYLSMGSGRARSIQRALEPGDPWAIRYAQSNPADTDGGLHPQNLLRLVARGTWRDYRQEVRVRIQRVNLSHSAERGEWSGVLLFLRYQDADNLYYAGVRMDGTAVIKKKLGGSYTTLAQQPLFGNPSDWDREAHPSLLPADRWFSLAASIRNVGGAAHIELYSREDDRDAPWKLAAEAIDGGAQGPPILNAGHGGIRADFMDVEFADYAVSDSERR